MESECKAIRRAIIETAYKTQAGHIASSLSCVEILMALYQVKRPQDIIILSKGHAALALYATWDVLGLTETGKLATFCQNGTELGGHPDCLKNRLICASTGSLGQGLSIACGIALADRSRTTYCVIGDGEMNEGQIWEAIMFAAQYRLVNLVVVVDNNCLQSSGYTNKVMAVSPIPQKLRAFGWDARHCDGHNTDTLISYLYYHNHNPYAIVADTVKGKGVSFMELVTKWHTLRLTEEEYKKAIRELQ